MSLTTAQRSQLRVLADKYAQALATMRLAERELQEKREAYLDYVRELGDDAHEEGNP